MNREASANNSPVESQALSLVGLGKLGLCMAGAFANAGFRVIGVDINQNLIDMVNRGEVPYFEKGLAEVLSGGRANLTATADIKNAILNSETTFIVVATPTQPDGTYGNEQLEAALKSIGEVLREKKTKHKIVVSCTVMPGTIEAMAIPLVEKVSGKKLGEGFSIAYNPEFIAMGDILRIFTEPDFVLVGESETEIGQTLEKIYGKLCPNNPPISRMNLINAELAKISLNCFVTTKITYANMLSELCEKLPGANVDVISAAIGQDIRIGGKVLKGGIGFGGPCFPRDNRAFVRLASDHGMEANLARQTHETNQNQIGRLQKVVTETVPKGGTVAVLGLAYRTDTPLVEESQALILAKRLAESGYKVKVHDFVALENAKRELGDLVSYFDSPTEAIKQCDGAVVTMLDPRYKEMNSGDFVAVMNKDGVVIDPWRLYLGQDFKNLRHRPLGVGVKRG